MLKDGQRRGKGCFSFDELDAKAERKRLSSHILIDRATRLLDQCQALLNNEHAFFLHLNRRKS